MSFRLLVVAPLASAGVLLAAPAHADSCFPPPPEFVVPSTTESLADVLVVPARGPMPTDVRPRVILRAESCSGLDTEARLYITPASGEGEVGGETIRTSGSGWAVLELELDAPLEPLTSYQLCADDSGQIDCVSFETLDGTAPAPAPPVLAIDAPDVVEDGDWLLASVRADTTWSPFVGAVWLEVRDERPIGLPLVLAYDAQTKTEDRAVVDTRVRAGDEVCVVAVGRGANGTIAESEPACFDASAPPSDGCALSGAPSSPRSGAAAALLALALAAGVRRLQRRR